MNLPATALVLAVVWLTCGFAKADEAPRLLVSVSGKKSCLAWTPVGQGLAFLATVTNETRLYVQGVGDGKPADLGPASSFAWSPDGRALVIARPKGGAEYVCLRAWPGGAETNLAVGGEPVFARDGQSVAFLRDGLAYVRPVAGGKEQALTAVKLIDLHLSAAPNGFFLTGNGCLWLAQPGADKKLVCRNAGMGTDSNGLEFYADLCASPDGSRIVIVSSGRQDAGGGLTTLILVNADGSGKKDIGPGQQPCWSPDGRALVFSSLGDLRVYTVESGAMRRLTRKRAANHAWPAYASDSQTVAFVATLADTNGDGKTDWRDVPSIFTLLPDKKGPPHDPTIK